VHAAAKKADSGAHMRNSLEKLETEVERLKGLYALSETLFSQSFQRVCSLRRSIDPGAPFGVEWRNRTVFVAADKNDLGGKLRKQFPRYLRETIFVRLVSAALDVFLVEVVEAIPSVGGAVHGKLGKSLEETRKFYLNKLTLDLKAFSNWDKIDEMQALRNELVHRLGLVDPKSKYREKHKYMARHANITGLDLRDWFEVVLSGYPRRGYRVGRQTVGPYTEPAKQQIFKYSTACFFRKRLPTAKNARGDTPERKRRGDADRKWRRSVPSPCQII
jgi:hypothetical protein